MINECIWKSCLVDHSSLIVFSVCFRLVPTLIPTCSRSNLGSTQVQLWFTFGLDRTESAIGAPVDCRWYGYKTAAEANQILKKLSSLVMGPLFYHITFKSHGHETEFIGYGLQRQNLYCLPSNGIESCMQKHRNPWQHLFSTVFFPR